MVKLLFAAVASVTLCGSDAASQGVVQRSDWQDRKFETYLPKLNATVPWLELDTKTRPPKRDIPLGRNVASAGFFVLRPLDADVRLSTNVTPTFRRM